MVGASARPFWRGVAAPTMSLMWCGMVMLIGLDQWPSAIDPLVFLMNFFPCSRPMDRLVFPGREGTPETLLNMIRYQATLVIWSFWLMQMLPVCWLTVSMTVSDASWCPLWSRMSWLAEVSAKTWFPFQDVGDCSETCVHRAESPQVARANHISDDISSFDLLSSDFQKAKAESKTHVAESSSGGSSGGAVTMDEGGDKTKKGGRRQGPRLSQ